MNKKALLIVIPLFAVLSVTVVPAFATASVGENYVGAVGWAYLKNSSGVCSSGRATLGLFLVSPSGGTDRFVGLQFVGALYSVDWLINVNSIKLEKNFETFCATPSGGGAPAPIIVAFQTQAPYCLTAFGCGFVFVGKVTTASG